MIDARPAAPPPRPRQVLNRAIFPIKYPERMYKDVLAYTDVTQVGAAAERRAASKTAACACWCCSGSRCISDGKQPCLSLKKWEPLPQPLYIALSS